MNDKFALAILRNNPEYEKILAEKIKRVKDDKINLLNSAKEVAEKYKDEIEEGTRKKQYLLTEGKRRGLDEEDVMKHYGRFLPTRQTPILNLIYFILREDSGPTFEELRKEFFQKYGHEYDGLDKSQLEEKYGAEIHVESVNENVKEHPDVDDFIYGNMSHDMFKKIKKLKALSRSCNEKEAFLAYRACIKLCQKYSLDFDKIPCNIR